MNGADPTGLQCTGSMLASDCSKSASRVTCSGNCGKDNILETPQAQKIYQQLKANGDAYGEVGEKFGKEKPGQLIKGAREELLKVLEAKHGGRVSFSRQNWWVNATPKQHAKAVAELRKIRTELAEGYVERAGRDTFMQARKLNSYQIYQLHMDVFARHGIGSRAYGGSQFTGTSLEGTVSAIIWCPSCLIQ